MKEKPTAETITNKELYMMVADLKSEIGLIDIDVKKSRTWFKLYVRLLVVLITVGITLGGIIIYLELK